MSKAEEIFHNKMVHYNSRQFPKGMQKMFIKAMEEYCNSRKSEIDELKAEVEELKKTIDFKDRLYKGLNGMFQEKEAEMKRSRLHTLNDIKCKFDIHSDSSTFCNGYRSLCRIIKEEEEKLQLPINQNT